MLTSAALTNHICHSHGPPSVTGASGHSCAPSRASWLRGSQVWGSQWRRLFDPGQHLDVTLLPSLFPSPHLWYTGPRRSLSHSQAALGPSIQNSSCCHLSSETFSTGTTAKMRRGLGHSQVAQEGREIQGRSSMPSAGSWVPSMAAGEQLCVVPATTSHLPSLLLSRRR